MPTLFAPAADPSAPPAEALIAEARRRRRRRRRWLAGDRTPRPRRVGARFRERPRDVLLGTVL